MKCIKESPLEGGVKYQLWETDDQQFKVVVQLEDGLELTDITFPTVDRCEEFVKTYKLLRG